MATQYRKRHPNHKRGVAFPQQMMFMALAFVIGYLSASLIDFRQLSIWLSTHSPFDGTSAGKTQLANKPAHPPKPKLEFYTLLTANHGATIVAPPVPTQSPIVAPAKVIATSPATITAPVAVALVKQSNTSPSQPPVVTAHPVSVATPVLARTIPQPMKPTPVSVQANKAAYTLQVAAFRMRQDAEHMKASLLLKGFDASVIAIESQHVPWFRVMVGPFASQEQAQKTQTLLARRERMNGMIRKMDA